MNPGKLDRRITVQVRTLTKDAVGGRVETWVDSFSCWAEAVRVRQTEATVADADRATEERQFRIRHRAGLASGTHRVFYQLRFYDITGIDEEGRQESLLITARAVQALVNH